MSALEHIVGHIRDNLQAQRTRPLFVALQGPQGSGKTYLTEHAASTLRNDSLRVATLSIDDLYLPHESLVALAQTYPRNGLLHGRGQPGTHDVSLGANILGALKRINETQEAVRIPAFDKSQFDGEGDRVPEEQWAVVHPPLDIIILEGWCVGFYPQIRDDIARKLSESPKGLDSVFDMSKYSLDDIMHINDLLALYIAWWNLIDVFVQITPEDSNPYVHIYKWRLEQEHWMKDRNGGRGMTDEQVKSFVDRYIPGYHFFGCGVTSGGIDPQSGARLIPPWVHEKNEQDYLKFLRVTVGEERQVIRVEKS